MSQICISQERFENLLRCEHTLKLLEVYLSESGNYPDKDTMIKFVNYGMTGMPFKPVKVETISKRHPEEGWQE